MQSQINKWGNSAAIRIPAKVLSELGLTINSRIEVTIKDGCIVIEPIKQSRPILRLPISEESLLDGLNSNTSHSDEVATPNAKEFGE